MLVNGLRFQTETLPQGVKRVKTPKQLTYKFCGLKVPDNYEVQHDHFAAQSAHSIGLP